MADNGREQELKEKLKILLEKHKSIKVSLSQLYREQNSTTGCLDNIKLSEEIYFKQQERLETMEHIADVCDMLIHEVLHGGETKK